MVSRMSPPPPPRSLYKYLGTSDFAFRVLEELHIRFSQPSVVNDPFDCRPQVVAPADLDRVVADQIDRATKLHPNRWSPAQVAIARVKLLDSYNANLRFRIRESQELLNQSLEAIGLLCLTETNDNLLMWAHYADSHKGFVLEFDTSRAPLIQRPGENEWQGLPVAVSYQDGPITTPCDSLELELPDELVLRKSTAWKYEREWRVVRDRSAADREPAPGISQFKIDPKAIVAVYVGASASEATYLRLQTIINGNPDLAHVRLVRAQLSTNGGVVFP